MKERNINERGKEVRKLEIKGDENRREKRRNWEEII